MKNPATDACEDLSEWSKVIQPRRKFFDLRLAQLWKYRDLIMLFVRRDLVSLYKQTVLGPVWFLVQPFLTSVMFTMVFGNIAKISTDGVPKMLFYMSGVVAWGYFADCFNRTSDLFGSNSGLYTKVYFPRLAMPIATVLYNLVSFTIQFAFFLCFFWYFKAKGAPLDPSWRVIVLPLLLLQMAMLGLGCGCITSSMTTRYRDLKMLIGFGVQLWMYASCVVFPLSSVPADKRWIFVLNPMVPIIEGFRFSFLGTGVVEIWHLAVGFCGSLIVLLIGLAAFSSAERTFADTV